MERRASIGHVGGDRVTAAEHLPDPIGFDQNREGGEAETVRKEAAERTVDRGHEVRAASDGLGQKDVDRLLREQAVGARHEVVEATAEAAPRDLRSRQPEAAEDGRIDDVVPLVVRDDADGQTSTHQLTRRRRQRRGLSGPEEAADTAEDNRSRHRPRPTILRFPRI